jgi:hypothetical protein
MTQETSGRLIANIAVTLLILLPVLSALIIQIKFIGLHRDINKMISNPSQLINNMYYSFVPVIGSVIFYISIIKMRNRLNQEFKIKNFNIIPKSNIFAEFYLIWQVLVFVIYVTFLFFSNSSNGGFLILMFGVFVIYFMLYFAYWVHLYEDKVKLFIAKN